MMRVARCAVRPAFFTNVRFASSAILHNCTTLLAPATTFTEEAGDSVRAQTVEEEAATARIKTDFETEYGTVSPAELLHQTLSPDQAGSSDSALTAEWQTATARIKSDFEKEYGTVSPAEPLDQTLSPDQAGSSDSALTAEWQTVTARIKSDFEKELGTVSPAELLHKHEAKLDQMLSRYLLRRGGLSLGGLFTEARGHANAAGHPRSSVTLERVMEFFDKTDVTVRPEGPPTFASWLKEKIGNLRVRYSRGVDFEGTSVLLFGDELPTLQNRHVRSSRRAHRLRLPSRGNESGKPTVVTGSSGSGKTDYMITTTTGGATTVVLYTTANKVDRNATLPTTDKGARDSELVRRIRVLIDRALEEGLPTAQGKTGKRFETDKDTRVRLVIDEVGSRPQMVRAAISAEKDLRQTIAELVAVDERHVEVFVGGTGSSSPDEPWGTEPGKYDVLPADDHGGNFTEHFWKTLPKDIQDHLRSAEAAMPATVSEYRALLSNPRLGALVSRHVATFADFGERTIKAGYPDYSRSSKEAVLVAPAVSSVVALSAADGMRAFFNLNGLQGRLGDLSVPSQSPTQAPFGHSKAEVPQSPVVPESGRGADAGLVKTLVQALAIDVGCYDSIEDVPLRKALVGGYGVLKDRAREVPAQDKDHPRGTDSSTIKIDGHWRRVLDGSERTSSLTHAAEARPLIVPLDCRGRYEMPDAYRAMLLRLLFGDFALDAGGGEPWQKLELQAWRWAAMLLACVTPERTLWDLVQLSSVGRLYAANQADDDERAPWLVGSTVGDGEDPLRDFRGTTFKGLLAEDPTMAQSIKNSMDSPGVRGGKNIALVRLRKQMVSLNLSEDSRRSVSALNALRAPFADVIARTPSRSSGGPGETLLLQPKRYAVKNKLPEFAAEMEKVAKRIKPSARERLNMEPKKESSLEKCYFVGIAASAGWKWSDTSSQKTWPASPFFEPAMVLHLAMNEAGGWTKSTDNWTRPELYPLILGRGSRDTSTAARDCRT